MLSLFKNKKNAIILFVAAALVLLTGAAGHWVVNYPHADEFIYTVGSSKYSILSEEKKEVQYKGSLSAKSSTVDIPAMVNVNGVDYKVTSIANKALKNNKNVKSLTIGKNVAVIGKEAFCGCQSLKNLKVNTTLLTKSSVKAAAFKNINCNAVITVPEEKLSAYKAIFKSRGLKNQKIKGTVQGSTVHLDSAGSKLSENDSGSANFEKNETDQVSFTIGDWSDENPAYTSIHAVRDSKEYSADDTIPFTVGLVLHPDVYGTWKIKQGSGVYVRCGKCGSWFKDYVMAGNHYSLSTCGVGNAYIGEKDSYPESYFVPDDTPCKAVYSFVLPESLSYKDGSLKVVHMVNGEVDKSTYKVNVSGRNVAVEIFNIKGPEYYRPFDYEEYKKDPYAYEEGYDEKTKKGLGEGTRVPINVTFEAVMNETISLDNNTVSASISYSCKDREKKFDLGTAEIHAAAIQISNTDMDGNSLDGAVFDLYQEKPEFKEGASYGTAKWVKIAEGLKAGDVYRGAGMGWDNRTNGYRVVQVSAPFGYTQASAYSFTIGIQTKKGEKSTVTAVNDFTDRNLDVENGIIKVNVVNRK